MTVLSLTSFPTYAKATTLLGLTLVGGICPAVAGRDTHPHPFDRGRNRDVPVALHEAPAGPKRSTTTRGGITQYAYTIEGSVSNYSRADSCNDKKGTACITASGEEVTAGRTVACPRAIPLFRRVVIQGHEYVCTDRTALWVERKFGPTFDIFVESHEEAVQFGRKKLEVTILSKEL